MVRNVGGEARALATWYVHDNQEASWNFPQAMVQSGTRHALDIYMRCVCVFFATAIRDNSGWTRMFYTNLPQVPEPYAGILAAMQVDTVCLTSVTRRPMDSENSAWGNQFFIFDVLEELSHRPFEIVAVVDSDCVVKGDLGPMATEAARYGALSYALDVHPRIKMNGVSLDDMAKIYNLVFGCTATSPILYSGGEFFCATRSCAAEIVESFRYHQKALFSAFADYRGGEEAHALSLIYYKLEIATGTANAYVKRCWTGFKHRNVTSEDTSGGIVILHLPAEKRTGIKYAFSRIDRIRSMTSPEFDLFVASAFGLPRRGIKKGYRDLRQVLLPKIAQRLFRNN